MPNVSRTCRIEPPVAGLLDGRRSTTHWLHAESFKHRFPRVRLEEDALYIHDDSGPGRISTSAGCTAGLDLCLAVVREDFGIGIANTIARRMVASLSGLGSTANLRKHLAQHLSTTPRAYRQAFRATEWDRGGGSHSA